METKRISPDYIVTAQIEPSDMEIIHGMGVKTLLALRPDDEEANQPLFETFAVIAERMGIATHRIDLPADGPTPEAVTTFRDLMETTPRPVLAFSRSREEAEALYRSAFD